MDRAEEIIASKRLARADEEWRSFVAELPAHEREIASLLVAHLDARPVSEDVLNLLHDAKEYVNGREGAPPDPEAAMDAILEAQERLCA